MKTEITRKKNRCYCINIRRAANAVTEYYDKAIKPSGLTLNQFSLLKNMSRIGVCSVSGLAEYVGLERSTLVRNLKPLFAMGYLEDISAPGARSRQIRVTAQGLRAADIAVPLWEEAQNGLMEKIGTENMQAFMDVLSELETM